MFLFDQHRWHFCHCGVRCHSTQSAPLPLKTPPPGNFRIRANILHWTHSFLRHFFSGRSGSDSLFAGWLEDCHIQTLHDSFWFGCCWIRRNLIGIHRRDNVRVCERPWIPSAPNLQESRIPEWVTLAVHTLLNLLLIWIFVIERFREGDPEFTDASYDIMMIILPGVTFDCCPNYSKWAPSVLLTSVSHNCCKDGTQCVINWWLLLTTTCRNLGQYLAISCHCWFFVTLTPSLRSVSWP
jgi:hypothetical protein